MRLTGLVVSTPASHAGSWDSTPGGRTCKFCITKVAFTKKGTLYAISKLLFEENKRYMLYWSSFLKKKLNAIRSIEVTVRIKQNAIRCIKGTVRKKNECYTLYQWYFTKRPYAIRCIEVTLPSSGAMCLEISHSTNEWKSLSYNFRGRSIHKKATQSTEPIHPKAVLWISIRIRTILQDPNLDTNDYR